MNNFFYLDNNKQQRGPISPDRFAEYGVTPDSYVWRQGMDEWMRAADVPELKGLFAPRNPFAADDNRPNPYARNNEYNDNGTPSYGERRNSWQGGTNYGSQNCRYQQPSSYLWLAIMSTICCCLPFGIVAIIKSSQVSTLYAQGRYDEAFIASEDAKKWAIIAIIFGAVSSFLCFVLQMLAFAPLGLLNEFV